MWLTESIPNATSYALHRDRTADFVQSSANKLADFTSATVPSTQAGAFVDTNLVAKKGYYYKMSVARGTTASFASSAASAPASARCPDLVVESVSVQNLDGTAAPSPTVSGTPPPSFRFVAVIKNQGEGTSVSFDNRFLVNDSILREDQRITGGLAANATKSVTSGSWTADPVPSGTLQLTRTVKVCADQPPDEGVIVERHVDGAKAEDNNCLERTITIVPPIKTTLECWDKNTNTWKKDFCIVDYGEKPQFRITPEGNPDDCEVREVGGTFIQKVAARLRSVISLVLPDRGAQSGTPFSYTFRAECTR